MSRCDQERSSREELIELVVRLQLPEKALRNCSKPPLTVRKERNEQAKAGGTKLGHVDHGRVRSDNPDAFVHHRPDRSACCDGALHGDLPAEIVSLFEWIELPEGAPVVTQHRRLALQCLASGTRVIARVLETGRGTPFDPRIHVVATYLKTF